MLEASLSAALGAAACPADLDEVQRLLLAAVGEGSIEDEAAERLFQAIAARRKPRSEERPLRTIAGGLAAALPAIVGAALPPTPAAPGAPAPRRWTIFKPRAPRVRDREAARRHARWLAASGPIPPVLASNFTTTELAVLLIVADECREKGKCELSIDELADRSKSSRATVKRAFREAEALEFVAILRRPQPGKKNLPNLVTIIDATWKAWIARRPAKSIGVQNRTSSGTESKNGFSEGRKAASPAPQPSGRSENRAPGGFTRPDRRRRTP